MAVIRDKATTFNVLADRLVVDMRDQIFLLEPSAAPLSVLISRLKKIGAQNPRYDWLEDELLGDTSKITNNAGTGTTITLGDTGGATGDYVLVVPHTLLKVPSTGEVMLVTAVNTSNGNITVTRGYGTSTTSVDGSSTPVEVIILGRAFVSGSDATALNYVTTKQTDKYNYTQIMREPVKVSKTAANTKMYGGPLRVSELCARTLETWL